MEIKVLGPGCPKCEQTEQRVKEAIAESGIEASVEKVKDIMEIAKHGVFMTPAVVVEGGVKSVGKVPSEDLLLAPGEANLGLGCGNPIGVANLKPGEAVLDLGSGAGFDAYLAARRVGESGFVIGTDMTSEMIEKAKANAEELNINNVEFRFGKIEALPVEDASVDVVISNCVINLSPDKRAVFGEIHRVLKLECGRRRGKGGVFSLHTGSKTLVGIGFQASGMTRPAARDATKKFTINGRSPTMQGRSWIFTWTVISQRVSLRLRTQKRQPEKTSPVSNVIFLRWNMHPIGWRPRLPRRF